MLSYFILIYLSSRRDICKDFTDFTNVDVNRHFLKTLRRLERVFTSRGIGSELTQPQSQCRAKSNEPEMKGASLLSIYLKNLLGDLC